MSNPQTPPQTYDLICAWCGLVIGQRTDTDGNSHGICPACYQKQLQELEQLTAWITLSNGQQVRVPAGADPAYVRKIEENKLRAKTHPRRKTTRRSSSHKTERNWTASSVLSQANSQALAMAELTERTNRTGAGND